MTNPQFASSDPSQYQPYPQSGPMYAQQLGQPIGQAQRTSGLCVAGMVLGIVTLVLFWIPVVSLVMSILGVALSGAGMAQTNNPQYSGRGMGIAGLVCGVLALVLAIVVLVRIAEYVPSM